METSGQKAAYGKRPLLRGFLLTSLLACLAFTPVFAQQTGAGTAGSGGEPAEGEAAAAGEGAEEVTEVRTNEDVLLPPKLYVAFSSGGGISPELAAALQESLVTSLASATDIRIIEPDPQTPVPSSDSDLSRLARRAGADSWLRVSAGRAGAGVRADLTLYDLEPAASEEETEEGALVFERQVQGGTGPGALESGFWSGIAAQVDRVLPLRPQKLVLETTTVQETVVEVNEVQKGVELEIEAEAGTTIRGIADKPIDVDESGRISIELPQRTSYRLRAEHWDLYPVERELYLGREDRSLKLEQDPAARWALHFQTNTHTNHLLAYYYLLPEYLFVGPSIHFAFFSMFPPFEMHNDWQDYVLGAGLDIGFTLLPPDSLFRFSLGVGGFYNLFFANIVDSSFSIAPHPFWPYGARAFLHFELSRHRNVKFVIRWAPEFYLINYDELPKYMSSSAFNEFREWPYEDFIQIGNGDGTPVNPNLFAVNLGRAFFGAVILF
ncbi:MAG: hypothetical protein K9L68_05745 [Spirochaetales bacterium]|nr:hypothetical protein [Spirochaetales bacterium]MCF7938083.1 hypothetical protein [Spirochaetales bacterium]